MKLLEIAFKIFEKCFQKCVSLIQWRGLESAVLLQINILMCYSRTWSQYHKKSTLLAPSVGLFVANFRNQGPILGGGVFCKISFS